MTNEVVKYPRGYEVVSSDGLLKQNYFSRKTIPGAISFYKKNNVLEVPLFAISTLVSYNKAN